MYTFSPKLKMAAIAFMVVGLILFAVGAFMNAGNGIDFVKDQIATNAIDHYAPDAANAADAASAELAAEEHAEHLLHLYHNKPWSALMIAAFLFTGVALSSMFFLAIQHAAQAGWSVVVSRVMEGMTVFLPYGGALLLIVLVGSVLGYNHLFHWMVKDLRDFGSENFDHFLKTKEPWLNEPFWLIRSVIYIAGWTLFAWILRKKSKTLDQVSNHKNYWSLYKWSILTIIFFSLTSMSSSWDWVMSIDPHWYSSLFGWYVMVSYLVTAVAIMILVSIHLKNQGVFPEFNDNHLHDLTKYLFGFSLLWGYLWLCQFELIWYANIPEEAVYFQQREEVYNLTYYKMLIPNVVIPFLMLISSSIKRNYTVVSIAAVIIILGHWLDIFNQMMPGTVGPWWQFGLLEFGALFFVGGLFLFITMNAMTKLKLQAKGNPLYHESKIYEYPF